MSAVSVRLKCLRYRSDVVFIGLKNKRLDRKGDSSSNYAILADATKSVGDSIYGKSAQNSKHLGKLAGVLMNKFKALNV